MGKENAADAGSVTWPQAAEIAELLSRYKFSWTNEEDLQRSIAQVLAAAGIEFQREVGLNARDRIDFRIGQIGIECKVAHSVTEVIR